LFEFEQGGATKENESEQNFASFWQFYPKRVGKLAAEKAFQRAIDAGHRPEAILTGARAYAAERANESERYTKHPATWLSGGCWLDEHAPANGGVIIDELGNEIAQRPKPNGGPKSHYQIALEMNARDE
jgi:hypothetical protein